MASFDSCTFDRGAGRARELSWLLLRTWFFTRSVMPWYGVRRGILRMFGASIGERVVVKPGVKIAFPWRLSLGANTWVGEESWILNLATVSVGSNVCISQRAFLCTGNHDWSDPGFRLVARPIEIGDAVWICANVFVGPGVTIGAGSVVTAGSIVTRDLPPGMVCSGNPCVAVKPRTERDDENPAPQPVLPA